MVVQFDYIKDTFWWFAEYWILNVANVARQAFSFQLLGFFSTASFKAERLERL